MKQKRNITENAIKLRQKAEEIFKSRSDGKIEEIVELSPEKIGENLHELQVHQIELEMQNEELRRTQVELEAAWARYFDLYDLAPVGYCTISESGIIIEANLTAAHLIGAPRVDMVNQPFSKFIRKEDQDVYYLARKQLFASGVLQNFELRLLGRDDTAFWADLTATLSSDEEGIKICRLTMSDIDRRKLAEKKLQIQLEEMQHIHTLMMGRESRIMALKKEVNELLEQSGNSPRYPSAISVY